MSLFLRNRLCFPVMGYNRAIVYNLIRMSYDFIPLDIYEIIKTDGVILDRDLEKVDVQWRNFLEEKEILFSINDLKDQEKFPSVSKSFDEPSLINNIIIHDNFPINLISEFKSFYLSNISIICEDYDTKSLRKVSLLLKNICSIEVDSVYLYVKSRKRKIVKKDIDILQKHNQVFSIYNFNEDSKSEDISTKLVDVINLQYSFEDFTRLMMPEKLRINYSYFFESHFFHSYYNKKVYIDKHLNIKNGINNSNCFGKLGEVDFESLIKSNKFKRLGEIKKEDTLICKNCEFRYMCVDPRETEQNNNNEWFHETECNYNPYISKWSYEDDYLNLQSSGIVVNSKGELEISEEKLHEKLKSIWS